MAIVKVFQCVGDMLRDCADAEDLNNGDQWSGGRKLPKACEYVMQGASESECREAKSLFDKIDASFRDRDNTAWMPSVCGAYPVVPEFLMGLPENMRARRPVESDVSPIRLCVEVVVSGGISQQEKARQGAALAALAMRASELRPVELWIWAASRIDGGSDTVIAAKVEAPYSMAQIVAVFASHSFGRAIMSALANKHGNGNRSKYNGGWKWALGKPGSDDRDAKVRGAMGWSQQDVVIQGGYLPDAALMERDPVEWVHRQLEKQRTVD